MVRLAKESDLSTVRNFLVFISAYGFLINYTLKVLLNFPITLKTILAWGIFYYFIREEIVRIIRRIIGR